MARRILSAIGIAFLLGGCSLIVKSKLDDKKADAGASCMVDDDCLVLDPSNCEQSCIEGTCSAMRNAADGTSCDTGATARELCIAGNCRVSECGDGFIDRTATTPEYCEMGRLSCEADCSRRCGLIDGQVFPVCDTKGDPCDGTEACVSKRCAVTRAPLDEGADCTTRDGTEGTCVRGVCTAPTE